MESFLFCLKICFFQKRTENGTRKTIIGLRKQGGKADHLGLNKSLPATCFPTVATLANSWDQELVKEVGVLLGKEAASEDVSVLLGPGLNIKSNPLCGRNLF